jgi:N-acylneuraminate cytidylyltransferase
MSLCVIPARAGSKRIPRKNIRDFAGKPIIAWSIEAALNCGQFDHVVVSTDDDEIKEIAESYGALVPFMRPEALSDDFTPTAPVVSHAIRMAESIWGEQKYVCCLYATAPFVFDSDIRLAKEKLVKDGNDFVFPITSFPFPIYRSVKLLPNENLEMFFPEHALSRSQDLEESYHDAGQFYWGKRESWLAEKPIMSSNSAGIIIPRIRVQDIDTFEDWQTAEVLFQLIKK